MKGVSIFVIPFYLLLSQSIFAQQIRLETNLSKDEVLIGEPLSLQIHIQNAQNTVVDFFATKDGDNSKIQILEAHTDTTFASNGAIQSLTQTYTLSIYEPGKFTLSPYIKIAYKGSGKTEEMDAVPLLLNVKTIAVDTTKGIKDIHDVLNESVHFSEVVPSLILFICIVGIGILAFYFWKQYKNKKLVIPFLIREPLPAHQIALDALDELRNKNLWQQNYMKEYYTSLSLIFKEYLKNRFSIQSAEMTSDELTEILYTIPDLSEETIPQMKEMLFISDMVKFAKSNPLPDDHEKCFQVIYHFVIQTVPAIPANSGDQENILN